VLEGGRHRMMEEPHRWLEAISNRREYIRDQLKGATPVFAFSRPEGILLLGVGQGSSKVFEIYDRHGYAALGHPVDIEKVRQAAIEAAHMEGFTRSSRDVTLRRLISFALSTTLKNSFEQIFAPPIMVEAIFAEVGATQAEDVLVRLHYDGNHSYETSPVLVAHQDSKQEQDAATWLKQHIKPDDSIAQVGATALVAWKALTDTSPFAEIKPPKDTEWKLDGKKVEAALLDRKARGSVHYRALKPAEMSR
jgi:proteasome alpha subunit